MPRRVRITAARTAVVEGDDDWTFVRVDTDAGIVDKAISGIAAAQWDPF